VLVVVHLSVVTRVPALALLVPTVLERFSLFFAGSSPCYPHPCSRSFWGRCATEGRFFFHTVVAPYCLIHWCTPERLFVLVSLAVSPFSPCYSSFPFVPAMSLPFRFPFSAPFFSLLLYPSIFGGTRATIPNRRCRRWWGQANSRGCQPMERQGILFSQAGRRFGRGFLPLDGSQRRKLHP
jgi:hypothetical protein